ncbi:MAG: IS5 family transposase [Planctomycetota bacterium]|jgi:IS5 family transposase
MSPKRSRVHPPYKTKYCMSNSAGYDQSLINRRSITFWISDDAINKWNAKPTKNRGGQTKYSDLAIETALTLALVFHLPLRQTEGFIRSILELMGLDLDVPDHTTLSRRSKVLRPKLRAPKIKGSIDLIIDSSGLSIVGQGQWAAAKHGLRGQQGWKKLHLGVDEVGNIVTQELTDSNVDDAKTGTKMIKRVKRQVRSVVGDRAYDSHDFYDAAESVGANVVVPPIKNARIKKGGPENRNETIDRIKEIGRRRWKKEAGYHRQGKVENAFFRYKTIIGGKLRSRSPAAQKTEAMLACNILNRMLELARPQSEKIAS